MRRSIVRRRVKAFVAVVVGSAAIGGVLAAPVAADNDGIAECGGKFHLLDQPTGSGADRNGNGFICISNKPGGNDLFHIHDDH
jgi:hypothetical protein